MFCFLTLAFIKPKRPHSVRHSVNSDLGILISLYTFDIAKRKEFFCFLQIFFAKSLHYIRVISQPCSDQASLSWQGISNNFLH